MNKKKRQKRKQVNNYLFFILLETILAINLAVSSTPNTSELIHKSQLAGSFQVKSVYDL